MQVWPLSLSLSLQIVCNHGNIATLWSICFFFLYCLPESHRLFPLPQEAHFLGQATLSSLKSHGSVSIAVWLSFTWAEPFSGLGSISDTNDPRFSPTGQQTVQNNELYIEFSVPLTIPSFVERFQQRMMIPFLLSSDYSNTSSNMTWYHTQIGQNPYTEYTIIWTVYCKTRNISEVLI